MTGAGAGAGAGIFIILLFYKKMSETCVFPYLQFFDLRTMLIKKFEKIGGVSAKFHPNRSDFQFLVPAVFFFISSPKLTLTGSLRAKQII